MMGFAAAEIQTALSNVRNAKTSPIRFDNERGEFKVVSVIRYFSLLYVTSTRRAAAGVALEARAVADHGEIAAFGAGSPTSLPRHGRACPGYPRGAVVPFHRYLSIRRFRTHRQSGLTLNADQIFQPCWSSRRSLRQTLARYCVDGRVSPAMTACLGPAHAVCSLTST